MPTQQEVRRVFQDIIDAPREQRRRAFRFLKGDDLAQAEGARVQVNWLEMVGCADDYTYRLSIDADKQINIVCFGLPTVDANCEGTYDSVDDLPNWVQDRLAILMMIPITKPTPDIPEVGRRISTSVFWLYAPRPDAEK